MPEPGSLKVSPLNYKVAQKFDQHDTLDEYMSSAGLCINNRLAGQQDGTTD